MRKTMFAIAAAVALGTASIATGAMAAPHGGHGFGGHGFGGGGHFGGGHWHGGGIGIGPGVGIYDYGGCWQRQLVPTPFGPRWRLINVC